MHVLDVNRSMKYYFRIHKRDPTPCCIPGSSRLVVSFSFVNVLVKYSGHNGSKSLDTSIMFFSFNLCIEVLVFS